MAKLKISNRKATATTFAIIIVTVMLLSTITPIQNVVKEDNSKTFLSSQAYACQMFPSRISRAALTFTDFETLPSNWASLGGQWSIVAGGFKGKALQAIDNNQGIGGASQFYWKQSLAKYSSFNVTVKVKMDSTGTYFYGWAGLALLDPVKKWEYQIVLFMYYNYISNFGFGVLEIYRYTGAGWSWLNASLYFDPTWYLPYYPWFIIYLEFSRNELTNTNTFKVQLFNQFGYPVYNPDTFEPIEVSYVDNSASAFKPTHIGLDVDLLGGTRAYFEDFVVGRGDLHFVKFKLVNPDTFLVLYDMQVNWVGYGYAFTNVATVPYPGWMLSDAVVGTGDGGLLGVLYPPTYDFWCIGVFVDAVVAGDTYVLPITGVGFS